MATTTMDETVLDKLVRTLAQALRPERIVLFGRVARGDADAHSDIDLFVQVPAGTDTGEAARKGYAAIGPLYATLNRGVDIVVRDRAFVERYGDLVGCIVRSVKREGRVLYERSRSRR